MSISLNNVMEPSGRLIPGSHSVSPKIVWLHMYPVAAVKRVFTGFIPIICADINTQNLAIFVSLKPLYLQLLVPGILAVINADKVLANPEHMLRAALALTELQLAFPSIAEAELPDKQIFRRIMAAGCNLSLDTVLQLTAPYLVYPAPVGSIPGTNPGRETRGSTSNEVQHVELNINLEEMRTDIQQVLNGMISVHNKQCIKTLEWFLRASQLFSSAASQADYLSWIVLLAASLEMFSKSVAKHIEECNDTKTNKNKLINEKEIRRKIIGKYDLKIAGYSVTDLRNAIVHGKHGKIKLDSMMAEQLVYKNILEIEHELTPKMRKALKEFILNQDTFIADILAEPS